MEITIRFRTDTAAFRDDLGYEIAMVLETAGEILIDKSLFTDNLPSTRSIRDTNGNTIGEVKVTP